MSERDFYFDMVRGLAILFVVFIHALAYSSQLKVVDFDVLAMITRNAVNCAVPIFIAISGYFLSLKKIDTMTDYLCFLKRQVPRVYVPFLFWAIFLFEVENIKNGGAIFGGLWSVLSFQSSAQYYFIFLILQFYLLLPVFQMLFTMRGVLISLVVSLAACMLINYIKFLFYIDMPIVLYAGNTFVWMVFFVLGGYFGRGGTLAIKNSALIFLTFFMLFLSCVESHITFHYYHSIAQAVSAVMPFPILYSFCIVLILFNNRLSIGAPSLLAKLGSVSFGVFLMHEFVLRGLEKIVGMIGRQSGIFNLLIQMALSVVVILLCVVFIDVLARIFPEKTHRWIGLN